MSYNCAVCNYSTEFPSNFNRHNTSPRHLKLIAGELTRKTYKCPVKNCRYKTMHASNYQRHENMHKGEKTYIYKCMVCDYKIRDMDALGTHIKSKQHKKNVQKHDEYLKSLSWDIDTSKMGIYILTPDGEVTEVYKKLCRYRSHKLKKEAEGKKYVEQKILSDSDSNSESETETEIESDTESETEEIPYIHKKEFKKYYELSDDEMTGLLKKAYKWAEYNAIHHKNPNYLSRIFPKKDIEQIYNLSRDKVLYVKTDENIPEENCAITPLRRKYIFIMELINDPNMINEGYDEDDGDEMLKPKFIL